MNGFRTAGLVSIVAVTSALALGCGEASAPKGASYGYGGPGARAYGDGEAPASAPAASAGPGGWFDAPRPAQPSAQGSWSDDSGGRVAKEEQSPSMRPGLGTEWGETLNSRITSTPFLRADATSPFTTASMFYNDAAGIRAMANAAGTPSATSGTFSIGGGIVTVGLRDGNGHFLSGYVSGGKNYVQGEAGTNYTIVVRNRSPFRFEVVLSVDGLDVIDGKDASFAKRGYILDPRGELEVEGFRQSMDQVAAFKFGSVSSSYSNQKTGETRNVGVIGMAVFHERGTDPWSWNNNEVDTRHNANPFPGQFATPP
ncbi:MAG: hypothetical protein U0441_27455 [Polyangiaceae bacterium]